MSEILENKWIINKKISSELSLTVWVIYFLDVIDRIFMWLLFLFLLHELYEDVLIPLFAFCILVTFIFSLACRISQSRDGEIEKILPLCNTALSHQS